MRHTVHVICPWIPEDGLHAGYEVLQSYKRSAIKLGVELRLDIIGEQRFLALLMKISRRMTKQNLYAFSSILNIFLIIWVSLKYRNKNIFIYIEPDFLMLARSLSKIMDVGIIVHDDPVCYFKRAKKSASLISTNTQRFKDICSNAKCGIFISEFMKKTYKTKNESNFQAVHISYNMNTDHSKSVRNTAYNRIGIFGTPLSNELMDKSLDPIIQLSKILNEGDEIFIFNCRSDYFLKNVKSFKWMETKEYTELVNMCNFSLVDDKSYDIDFANYSFPTKLVFSIYNSLPVIYTGPEESAVAQFILEEKLGVVALPNDLNDLQSKFAYLKKHEEFFIRNCRDCYFRYFRQEVQTDKLNKVFRFFNV